MYRKNILSLILLDIMVIAFSLGLLVYRYRTLSALFPLSAGSISSEIIDLGAAESGTDIVYDSDKKTETPGEGDKNNEDISEHRNIRFVFRHSKARKVQLIGDFNNWVPQSFTKGEKHTWKIDVAIPPGNYAYNFVIDGKPIRDPNNPKRCNVGRGFPNSHLQVKPLKM